MLVICMARFCEEFPRECQKNNKSSPVSLEISLNAAAEFTVLVWSQVLLLVYLFNSFFKTGFAKLIKNPPLTVQQTHEHKAKFLPLHMNSQCHSISYLLGQLFDIDTQL